jgi:hypothetical protein
LGALEAVACRDLVPSDGLGSCTKGQVESLESERHDDDVTGVLFFLRIFCSDFEFPVGVGTISKSSGGTSQLGGGGGECTAEVVVRQGMKGGLEGMGLVGSGGDISLARAEGTKHVQYGCPLPPGGFSREGVGGIGLRVRARIGRHLDDMYSSKRAGANWSQLIARAVRPRTSQSR